MACYWLFVENNLFSNISQSKTCLCLSYKVTSEQKMFPRGTKHDLYRHAFKYARQCKRKKYLISAKNVCVIVRAWKSLMLLVQHFLESNENLRLQKWEFVNLNQVHIWNLQKQFTCLLQNHLWSSWKKACFKPPKRSKISPGPT